MITKKKLRNYFKQPLLHLEQSAATGLTPAAVLIPVIDDPSELLVLFTQRTTHLKNHAGQISFPGGSMEALDQSLMETALRETEEEIGLKKAQVTILGNLSTVISTTGFVVTPFIGLIKPPLRLILNPQEVLNTFTVPLNFLLNSINQKEELYILEDKQTKVWVINYEGYRIWGMTARILMNLTKELMKN